MITLTKEDAFTIVDIISKAQEIVRCKDCKHWFYFIESKKHHCTELSDKHLWDCPIMEEDDFCSRGEKKDGNY